MKPQQKPPSAKRRCSIVVNKERCEGPVDSPQAKRTLAAFGAVLCVGHEHARHAAKIAAEDEAIAQAYRDRVAKRKAANLA